MWNTVAGKRGASQTGKGGGGGGGGVLLAPSALLGKGSFGEVAICEKSSGSTSRTVDPTTPYAMKVSSLNSRTLKNEIDKYIDMGGTIYVPRLYTWGINSMNIHLNRFFIMERYDVSLKSLLDTASKSTTYSLTTNEKFKIIRDVLNGLEYIHNTVAIVHNDIKAANILLAFQSPAPMAGGCSASQPHSTAYLLQSPKRTIRSSRRHLFKTVICDFGLSSATLQVPGKPPVGDGGDKSCNRKGTVRYMSVLAHRSIYGFPLADIESLGWCMAEWFGGALTWKGCGRQKIHKVKEYKEMFIFHSTPERFLHRTFGHFTAQSKHYHDNTRPHSGIMWRQVESKRIYVGLYKAYTLIWGKMQLLVESSLPSSIHRWCPSMEASEYSALRTLFAPIDTFNEV